MQGHFSCVRTLLGNQGLSILVRAQAGEDLAGAVLGYLVSMARMLLCMVVPSIGLCSSCMRQGKLVSSCSSIWFVQPITSHRELEELGFMGLMGLPACILQKASCPISGNPLGRREAWLRLDQGQPGSAGGESGRGGRVSDEGGGAHQGAGGLGSGWGER